MHGDELFDRDDGFDSGAVHSSFVVIAGTSLLEPDIQQVVDEILHEREQDLSSKVQSAIQTGMDKDLITTFICERWRKAGLPVVSATINNDGNIELDIALPAGVG